MVRSKGCSGLYRRAIQRQGFVHVATLECILFALEVSARAHLRVDSNAGNADMCTCAT